MLITSDSLSSLASSSSSSSSSELSFLDFLDDDLAGGADRLAGFFSSYYLIRESILDDLL